MTVTHPDIETSLSALQSCGGILQSILPGGDQAIIEPIESTDARTILAQEGWRAISSRLVGLDATLIFAMSPEPASVLLNQSDDGNDDNSMSSVNPLFNQLGNMIGESLNVQISVTESKEIACEQVTNNQLNEEPLFAALKVDDQIAALLIVMYDAEIDDSSDSADMAIHEFAPLDTNTVTPAIRSLELLSEVEMGVTAELGRTRLLVKDILALTPGSVIELDRAAGSPIDVLVNGTLIARGEVVVIDEEFGIRISEIIGYESDSKGHHR
ncbi:MAG: flagellar motor switch protein FliN [Acidimicrobiales bacterium]